MANKEYPPKFDMLGEPLDENDTVICMLHSSTSSSMELAKIISFTEKTVKLSVMNYRDVRRNPKDLIKFNSPAATMYYLKNSK